MNQSKYTDLTTAIASGSRVESLKALADRLGYLIDNTDSARETASLSLRLVKVLEQIDNLSPAPKETAAEKHKKAAQAKKTKKVPDAADTD